jgi:glucosylceramidase
MPTTHGTSTGAVSNLNRVAGIALLAGLLAADGPRDPRPAPRAEGRTLSHEETLDWIARSRAWRSVHKTRPIWARAVEASEVGQEFQTADRAKEKARADAWLCIGIAGEPWFQALDTIEAKYTRDGQETRKFAFDTRPRVYRKYAPKPSARSWAAQVQGPGIGGFEIRPGYDPSRPLYAPAGGYVVKNFVADPYRDDPKDVWLVQQSLFESTYEVLREPGAELWLTDPGGSARFERQGDGAVVAGGNDRGPTIRVDARTTYQSIDGFGCTLTGGSARHIVRMSTPRRAELLRELFASEGRSIGLSYLRVSIGASDLDERVFSYDDVPPGQVDPRLEKFSLDPDRDDVIPVLREILQIAPNLKIMGSPWSPPAWMKTNQGTAGGSLKPEFDAAYARYLVKYIEGMRAEGIRIDAITVQNEPLHPGNNPSLLMTAAEQARFIKTALGPAFRRAGLDTKIVIYDHNCDRPDYPLAVLADVEARRYVDGSAFHLYAGKIDALSAVHRAYPDKHVYFTEQWMGAPGSLGGDLAWHTRELTIGATRHWARVVLEWNLAADPKHEPHTPGGCTTCLGALTIDGDAVTRNPAYYVMAHAAKFVRPGSVRVESNVVDRLPNVAFRTREGRKVLIVLNEGATPRTFAIQDGRERMTSTLPAGAVGTLVWTEGENETVPRDGVPRATGRP